MVKPFSVNVFFDQNGHTKSFSPNMKLFTALRPSSISGVKVEKLSKPSHGSTPKLREPLVNKKIFNIF